MTTKNREMEGEKVGSTASNPHSLLSKTFIYRHFEGDLSTEKPIL
jgi:hypothetical protein